MRISDWSSDVCSSDLFGGLVSSLVYDSVRVLRGSEVDGPLLREAFEVLADESMQWLHRQAPREWLSRHTLQYFAEMRYRSEEHTSELQSLMRISYAVFCLKKKTRK